MCPWHLGSHRGLSSALFLIFINDISDRITSNIRLFAYDTIIYRNIKNTEDAEKLQTDLDNERDGAENGRWNFTHPNARLTHYSVKILHPQRLHAVQHHTWSSWFCEIPWGHTHHRPPVQPSYWQHQKDCQRDPPIPKEESKDQLALLRSKPRHIRAMSDPGWNMQSQSGTLSLRQIKTN